ncbi:MAG: hypothetical protein N2559_07460, partial [Anaerolineae bacterium]|nr:hypothetical protein [Anaerolineae bacterium]
MRQSFFLPSSLRFVFGLLFFVFIIALVFPIAASAWHRNQANARIARAVATNDTSARLVALSEADAQLAQAEAWSHDALIEFARARVALVRDDAPRAVQAMRATGETLRGDSIAQFLWGYAEWYAGNASAAYERWRAAGAFEYFFHQAQRASFKHRWQQAAEYARFAVGIEPDNVNARYTLGDVLGYLDADAALRELEHAQKLTNDPE